MEKDNQSSSPGEESPPQIQESTPAAEPTPPPEEPVMLGKLFPEAKHDLDTLFPDQQMKKLLKDIHRTRQSNQRFLKRLNLSKIQTDEEEPPSEA